ncbi:MAG: sulfurtransferase [Desulfobacterales bacterium]
MNTKHTARFSIIAVVLLLGLVWSLSLAGRGEAQSGYPNPGILATAGWLKAHAGDQGVVIVDVRGDKHYDGRIIPGAVRLPWTSFRYDDRAHNIAEKFSGLEAAQELLGRNGLGRADEIVLYDSVKSDGGATASYVFWVLDVLGHPRKRILEGGIDAWERAGHPLASEPKTLEPILYQAPTKEIQTHRLIDARWIFSRLGDPMYQIVDARSRSEYLGERGAKDLMGNPLLLGHIPTAVNVDYTSAWRDAETKLLKPYAELQELYRGLDPDRGVIVYCMSGRRSAFSYFVLRLMGIDHVITYEQSWMEWGNPANFLPVETTERRFAGGNLPGRAATRAAASARTAAGRDAGEKSTAPSGTASGGYVSCGG